MIFGSKKIAAQAAIFLRRKMPEHVGTHPGMVFGLADKESAIGIEEIAQDFSGLFQQVLRFEVFHAHCFCHGG